MSVSPNWAGRAYFFRAEAMAVESFWNGRAVLAVDALAVNKTSE